MQRQKKCDVIQQLTPLTVARTRYQLGLSNLLDLTVSIRTSRLYSQIYYYLCFYRAAWNANEIWR